MLSSISHIAIAVNNFNQIENWEVLFGDRFKRKQYRSISQKVDALVFFNDKIKIEFLCPISNDSPISNFLKKNKMGGIHHISFTIENYEKNKKALKDKKIRIISDEDSLGVEGNKICFLNPMDLNKVLVELEEKE